ncbi:MAG: Uma2 family endonuclease [Blastocatellia bacterium]
MMQPLTQDQTEYLPADLIADVRARTGQLLTEDDTPVDNIFSEKQQRLLTEALYSSWEGPLLENGARRAYVAFANVGLFRSLYLPPIVPDVFLSLDVKVQEPVYENHHRSYFLWEMGKAPEIVMEIVSNREGNELGSKLHDYAQIPVVYYIIYDPMRRLGEQTLRMLELRDGQYLPRTSKYFPLIHLGLTLWEGEYEGTHALWLRWTNEKGELIPTGAERAAREAERAAHEAQRADRLADKLRELGIDPDQV